MPMRQRIPAMQLRKAQPPIQIDFLLPLFSVPRMRLQIATQDLPIPP